MSSRVQLPARFAEFFTPLSRGGTEESSTLGQKRDRLRKKKNREKGNETHTGKRKRDNELEDELEDELQDELQDDKAKKRKRKNPEKETTKETKEKKQKKKISKEQSSLLVRTYVKHGKNWGRFFRDPDVLAVMRTGIPRKQIKGNVKRRATEKNSKLAPKEGEQERYDHILFQ